MSFGNALRVEEQGLGSLCISVWLDLLLGNAKTEWFVRTKDKSEGTRIQFSTHSGRYEFLERGESQGTRIGVIYAFQVDLISKKAEREWFVRTGGKNEGARIE